LFNGLIIHLVDAINNYVLDLISAEEKTYLMILYVMPNQILIQQIHTPEFLNTVISFWIPNHKLRLKIGVPVILLRNIEQSLGLCNGTRLIITKLGTYVVEGRVIFDNNIGIKKFILRLWLTHSEKRIPFKVQRRQFPSIGCFICYDYQQKSRPIT
jgi:ATP-dependent DNA helicase PIF1